MIYPDSFSQRKIRQAFSQAAFRYESLTTIHQDIGKELLSRIDVHGRPEFILDIGMGTGWLAKELHQTFPQAGIIGIDFAEGMVARAVEGNHNFHVVQGCAEKLPFKDGLFDVIVSNLAYQWMADLTEALCECERTLKSGKKIFFTMFGYQTLHELFCAFEETVSRRESILFKRLYHERDVEHAVSLAGFRRMKMSTTEGRLRFDNMMELLKWIRDIGANQVERNFFLGKNLLNKVSQYYDTHFKDGEGVYATFEVIWVEAEK